MKNDSPRNTVVRLGERGPVSDAMKYPQAGNAIRLNSAARIFTSRNRASGTLPAARNRYAPVSANPRPLNRIGTAYRNQWRSRGNSRYNQNVSGRALSHQNIVVLTNGTGLHSRVIACQPQYRSMDIVSQSLSREARTDFT